MIANALRRLLAEAERANETWLKEAGQGLIDVSAINEARAALSASSYHLMVAAVDAAMVEMRNISPPLRRSECERLIRAALGFAQQATQPAEVTDERIDDVIKRHWGDACITIESIRQFARAILALRPEAVPMTMGQAVMYGSEIYAGIMEDEVREVKNSVLIEFPDREDLAVFLRWHDGITAQAKKETP